MAFSNSPRAVSPAYRPLWWRETRTTTASVEQMKVELYVFGSLYQTFNKAWYTSAGGTFRFDYDVQRALQDYLQPDPGSLTSVFHNLVTYDVVFNTDSFAPYYIVTTERQRNVDNFLEEAPSTSAVSSGFYAFNATTQNDENWTLDAYWYGASSATDLKFLTHAPTAQDIGYNESAFLSIITEGIDAMQFTFYRNGAAHSAVNTRIDTSASLADVNMVTVGMGPRQLTSSAASPTILGGGSLPTVAGMAAHDYYTVQAGYYHGTSGFLARTELRRYDLVDRCDDHPRFHFLNRLGGVDSFSFSGKNTKGQEQSHDEYQRGLTWNLSTSTRHRPYFRGPFKGNVESRVYMDVTTSVNTSLAAWLREMITSPEVYYENNDTYENVVIEGRAQPFDDNQEFNYEFRFRALFNHDFQQRN